jgi:adenylate kinase family enzyme
MERVLVLGGCGAGKSTFARQLGAVLDLPVIHVDAEYFRAGWVEPEPDVWRARVAELTAAPRWIMDGTYHNTLDLRLPHADTAIVLDLPTWLCLTRVLLRIATTYGRVRPDAAPGCPEQFDPEFIAYTALYRRRIFPSVLAQLKDFAGQIVMLRTPREVDAFLAARAEPARRSTRNAAI